MNRHKGPGVARELSAEAIIAISLLKEALRRVAGVPRGTSFLATIFALGLLAQPLRRAAAPALRVRPRYPSFAGAIIAIAVLRATLHGIAGVRARETPFAGTMIAIGVLGKALRPHRIALPTLRVRATFLRVRAALARRYAN